MGCFFAYVAARKNAAQGAGAALQPNMVAAEWILSGSLGTAPPSHPLSRDWPINESVIDLHAFFHARWRVETRASDRAALAREIQLTLNWPSAPQLVDDTDDDAALVAIATAPRASCVVLLTTLPRWTETRVQQLYETAFHGGFTHIQCRRWEQQDPFSLDRSIVLLRRAQPSTLSAVDSTRAMFGMWFEKSMLGIAQMDMQHGWRRLLERCEAEQLRASAAIQSTPTSSERSWRLSEEREDPSICSD